MFRRRPLYYPPYDFVEPTYHSHSIPAPTHYLPECSCRRTLPYLEHPSLDYVHPRVVSPTIIQTNVRNDISYHFDDLYPDEYIYPSRSRVVRQMIPKYPMYQRESPLVPRRRLVVPRPTMIRHESLPSRAPVRLVPLYHSADSQYPTRRRRVVQVRSLSP